MKVSGNSPTADALSPGLVNLQHRLHHSFQNSEYLIQSLTHSSFAYEAKRPGEDNERMEFLGDSVLGIIVSHYLYETHPKATPGKLSQLKSHYVSASVLAGVARKIRLGRLLRLGQGERKTKGQAKASLLCCALEAVIGAIYLDGGLEAAQKFIFSWLPELMAQGEPVDYKSQLQQYAQARYGCLPQYRIVQRQGPEHAQTFIAQVSLGGKKAQGKGRSKKEAQISAARRLLGKIPEMNNSS